MGMRPRLLLSLVVTIACGVLIASPAAVTGQDVEVPPDPIAPVPDEPPPGAGLRVEVDRVVVPNRLDAVLARGISVKATCSIDCLLTVKVGVDPATASKLDFRNSVLGTASTSAQAGQPRWVRVRLRSRARAALNSYAGGGRFRVEVGALP